MREHVFGALAARLLEDLLPGYGPAYVERVEVLARDDDRFKRLLRKVWWLVMTDYISARAQAARLGATATNG